MNSGAAPNHPQKSDGSSPANDSHNNGSPQLPKPTRPNEAAKGAGNTNREEYRNYFLAPLPGFFKMPWDDQPQVKEQNNGSLSLSGILHNSSSSTTSSSGGSSPGNKDTKTPMNEMNGHHPLVNGHTFAHHTDINEAQNGKTSAHEALHGELTAL